LDPLAAERPRGAKGMMLLGVLSPEENDGGAGTRAGSGVLLGANADDDSGDGLEPGSDLDAGDGLDVAA
jgi:hypothetical protein